MLPRSPVGPVLLLAVVSVGVLPAQQATAPDYREAVLAIQQQIKAGDLNEAQRQIVLAEKQFPANGGLDNLQGIVAVQRGDQALARSAFKAAVQHSPRLVAGYLNLARLDLESAADDVKGNEDALALYQRVLELDPGNTEASVESAGLLLAAGNAALAEQHLLAASSETQATLRAQAIRCGAAAALGNKSVADSLATALVADRDLSEADVRAALPGLRAGHRADLLQKLLTAAAVQHALSAEGLRLLGLAQEALGDRAAARTTLEQAFVADPNSVATLSDLSRVTAAQGLSKEALGYLAHARALAPRDAALPYQFGLICFEMNLLGEAQKAMGEALALKPDEPQYLLAMAKATMLSQEPVRAAPYLEHYRQLRPSDPEGKLLTGAMFFRAKDFDQATHWLVEAEGFPAVQASADLYLGSICRQQHDLPRALAYLQNSASGQPEDAQTHAELGETLFQLKRYTEAEAELNRAIKLDPDNYAANFGLVQLYAHNDDPRRSTQASRFEEVKGRRDRDTQQAMRVIEVRPDEGSLSH